MIFFYIILSIMSYFMQKMLYKNKYIGMSSKIIWYNFVQN